MDIMLFGAEADRLRPEVEKHKGLTLTESGPETVVCYGGDGTLLTAELRWPGVPKVPIRNSRRGMRCIARPPADVIARLAEGRLVRNEYMKLECAVRHKDEADPFCYLTAMNEFNVHNSRVTSAVRFEVYIDDQPYNSDREIIGDGFVASTPFGSTAYFCQITRGVFYTGMGLAFKFTAHHVNHLIVPETTSVRACITRGPAALAFDNAPELISLRQGDELSIRQHGQPAVLYTWEPMPHQTDQF